ncbi:hypothetical protein HZU77_016255 [Neisseriaceae bacterium TC5R-5]|nr:hypothetical protein [Neisseriaceae bacterium TC5R-5]
MASNSKKLAFWTEHSRQWRSSGLTQKAYCAQENLALKTFEYWHRQVLATQKSRKGFAPKVTLAAVSVPPDNAVITTGILLYSPGGWRVDLPAQIGPSVLGALLAMLP